MSAKESNKVSEPTLKRLPVYLQLLRKAKEAGVLTLSAPVIARQLGLDPTQVVKDLASTGASGRPRVGYEVHEIVRCLESFLGFDSPNDAFLIGAGNLGEALMSYPRFREYGLNIIAAFDIDPEKAGKSRSGINILPMQKLPGMSKSLEVRIAILTTPPQVAQEVCDTLLSCGIRAIWNLTPTRLNVPESVAVQNTSMYANVAILLNKLQDLPSQ